MYDSFRKSAKFTAAQNKEAKADFVECVGQIVAYAEKMGGQIPRYEIKTPLDIVDKVISDLKEYNKSLIYEDKALARQIEDYLQHRTNMEKKKIQPILHQTIFIQIYCFYLLIKDILSLHRIYNHKISLISFLIIN